MEDNITLIQKNFKKDFRTILDDSYFFESEMDLNGNIYVTATKLLDNWIQV